MIRPPRVLHVLEFLLALLAAEGVAFAERTPGFPERVLQWTVLPGETCDDIANALYGSAQHRKLLERYNAVNCTKTPVLPQGKTLIVPAEITEVAPALLQSLAPDVREKPPGGQWNNASSGMQLKRNHSVNTLERARADILFVDRSRVVLAAHTLVVIYGSAGQSTTMSSAPAVELDSGELQAGLRALGGKPPVVSVKTGGEIEADSKDTTVRTQKQRTTVSVFDGHAKVRAAGRTVIVPLNHGTAFYAGQKPEPPHALPVAPQWSASSDSGLRFNEGPLAVIRAEWQAIDAAQSYRVEIARDPEFRDLIAREEVPKTVTVIRAERMPVGEYYLRVRVIDQEDFLGIASEVRHVTVASIQAHHERVVLTPNRLTVSPYELLSLAATENVQLSIDGEPFDSVPIALDLMQRPARKLWFRSRDGKQSVVWDVDYRAIAVAFDLVPTQDRTVARARFVDTSSVAISTRVRPSLRLIHEDGSIENQPLQANDLGDWIASIDSPREALSRLELVDARGVVLIERPWPRQKPKQKLAVRPHVIEGLCAPFAPSRSRGISPLFAPSPCNAVVATWGGQVSEKKSEIAMLRATAKIGDFGVEATLRSNVSSYRLAGDDAVWLGARHRTLASGNWSLGPALRLALPTTSHSPLTRGELGWSLAYRWQRMTVISNWGYRQALRDARHDATAPKSQAFIANALLFDSPSSWTIYAQMDAVYLRTQQGEALGRYGITIGTESRGPWFVGAAAHASPWQDSDGTLSVQLSLGLRN